MFAARRRRFTRQSCASPRRALLRARSLLRVGLRFPCDVATRFPCAPWGCFFVLGAAGKSGDEDLGDGACAGRNVRGTCAGGRAWR